MRFERHWDAYRELGLTPDASQEAIRQAYRQLARRYHPDHAPDGKQREYEEKMKRVNAAYAILGNPARRAAYDAARQNGGGTATPPRPLSVRASPRDPYMQMRAGYQQRFQRVQVQTHTLPVWAQLLSGLFAGLGLVAGFLVGLPFGIVGCIPGALVGLIGGMVAGLLMVYLLVLGLPPAILGWLGYWAFGGWGALLGALVGLPLGWLWMRRQHRPH